MANDTLNTASPIRPCGHTSAPSSIRGAHEVWCCECGAYVWDGVAVELAPTFAFRVGDDGRWYGKGLTLAAARQGARDLSLTGWSGKAQIVDFASGARETWRDGEQISGDAGKGAR